jgi:hypothetical protein
MPTPQRQCWRSASRSETLRVNTEAALAYLELQVVMDTNIILCRDGNKIHNRANDGSEPSKAGMTIITNLIMGRRRKVTAYQTLVEDNHVQERICKRCQILRVL